MWNTSWNRGSLGVRLSYPCAELWIPVFICSSREEEAAGPVTYFGSSCTLTYRGGLWQGNNGCPPRMFSLCSFKGIICLDASPTVPLMSE